MISIYLYIYRLKNNNYSCGIEAREQHEWSLLINFRINVLGLLVKLEDDNDDGNEPNDYAERLENLSFFPQIDNHFSKMYLKKFYFFLLLE